MTNVEDASAPPAMFEHCKTVYEAMLSSAIDERVSVGGTMQSTGARIYEGHTTQLFQQLSLPTPYYTQVMRLLRRMGCIEQTRRGGGNSKSKWRLVTPPELSAFESAAAIDPPKGGSHAAQAQQLRDLTRRVQDLEKAIGL